MSQRILRRNRILEDEPGPSQSSEASNDEPIQVDANENFLQVPYFKDILQCAREFSSAHQSLATLMVNMGVLTKKKFYLSFIHEVVSVHLKTWTSSYIPTDEETGREMVVLVSEDVLPRDISSISGFSADELLLFSRYIPQFVDGGGQCESSWALNEATKLPNPITLVKAQNFLDKLVSRWLDFRGTRALPNGCSLQNSGTQSTRHDHRM
ncbi:hypothetical protein OSTOST_14983 [Ostertagia ostertagi]